MKNTKNELFLDTSGIPRIHLNGETIILPDSKTQYTLYPTILSLLSKHRLKMKDINCFIFCAGPGAYTGLRLAQSLAAIVNLAGIPVFSFYHHLIIPDSGQYCSWAFKGQTFLYDAKMKTIKLLLFDELSNALRQIESPQLFTCSYQPHSEKIISCAQSCGLKVHFTDLEQSVLKLDLKCTPFGEEQIFYYRPIEGEFTRGIA